MAICASGVLLAGCHDTSSQSQSYAPAATATGRTDTGSSSTVNTAPTISGAPAPQVLAGDSYKFEPSVDDPDGDTLRFSIANLPLWAKFDPMTGSISGTPGAGDVGQYPNIRISVSDGKAAVSLALFSIDVVQSGIGSATLSWVAPTENSDGSPLLDLAGYKVYWGQTTDFAHTVTLKNPGLTSYVIQGLTVGTWYFATTAFDADGVESSHSNIASKTISP